MLKLHKTIRNFLLIGIADRINLSILGLFIIMFLINSFKLFLRKKIKITVILKDFFIKISILLISNLIAFGGLYLFEYSFAIALLGFFVINQFSINFYRKKYQEKLLKRGLKIEKSYSH